MGVPTSPYYPEVKDRLPEKIGGFLKNKYQNHQQAESIAL